jgi:cobalt-zinc-cadmium efflux system membrane fusion protein
LLLAGCQRETAPETPADPQVTGEKISFPAGSPQLAALQFAPAELHAPASIQLSGRLIWNDDVTVRVFTPFAGRVKKIIADIGAPVEKNGALAEVESPDFGQAQADARKAEGDLKLAERNLARLQELFAHGAAAQKDLEAAEDAKTQAEAEHARAVSKIAAYGANADSLDEIFTLRSPLAGIVVDKTISAGQEIRPDQMLANVPEITAPCYTVSDPTRLWIQIDATEADAPRLQPGQKFAVSSRAFPSKSFSGQVEKVAEFLDPNTRTIKVRGAIENAQRLLKAEMFVTVILPGETTTHLSVPAAAVFLNGEKHFVFVQEKPGQFTRTEVAIGEEQDGRILILSGLQAGQQVVTDGCVLLQQVME